MAPSRTRVFPPRFPSVCIIVSRHGLICLLIFPRVKSNMTLRWFMWLGLSAVKLTVSRGRSSCRTMKHLRSRKRSLNSEIHSKQILQLAECFTKDGLWGRCIIHQSSNNILKSCFPASVAPLTSATTFSTFNNQPADVWLLTPAVPHFWTVAVDLTTNVSYLKLNKER